MKKAALSSLKVLLVSALVSLASASAANLTWSPDGSGTWTTGAGGWINGGAVNWANNDSAFIGIGGTAGTISLGGPISATDITFNAVTGNYLVQNNTLTLAGSSTITVNDDLSTINSVIAGAGTSLIKAGTGTLVLGGTNTFSGRLDVNAGAISVASISNTGTNGTLGTNQDIRLGAGAGTSGTLIYTGTTANINRDIQLGSSFSTGTSNNGTGIINVATAATNLTISGQVGDSQNNAGSNGSLTKTGSGTLTLTNGGNIWSGNLTIDQGRLVASGANPNNEPVNGVLGQYKNGAPERQFVINNGGTLEFATGNIFGTGAGESHVNFTINGGGTVTSVNAAGSNFFFNLLTLNGGGTLTTGNGSGGNQSYRLFNDVTVGVGDATAATINKGAGTTTLNGVLLRNGTATTFTVADATGNSGSDLNVSAELIDNSNSSLTKAGAGTMLLSGTNTYAGTTTVNAGTILVGANAPSGSAGALGNASSAVLVGATSGTANAALLTNGAFTVGRNITVQSGNTGVTTLGGDTAAASTFSGSVNLGTANGSAKNVTLVALASGTATFSGVIDENTNVANSNVTIGDSSHAGTVALSNSANAYGGTTTVASGATLQVTSLAAGGVASSIGNSSSAAGNLVLDGGTLKYTGAAGSTDRLLTYTANGGTIDASGASNAAVTFTGNGSLVASGNGNRTLTLTGASTGANKMASVIANPGTGATSLAKTGAGNWLVSGSNTFSGGTTISAGKLAVSNNTALGSGAITLDGGTLQLTGGSAASVANGLAIGVNFYGGNGSPAIPNNSTPYGVVTISGSNWNNYNGNSGSLISLKDSSGATTGVGGSYTSPGSYGTTSSNPLLNGYLDNTGSTQNVVISGITYDSYDVYAYFGSDASGRTGSVNIGGTIYYYQTRGNVTDYLLTTNTISLASAPLANYAIFSGLTGAGFTLNQTRGSNNSGLMGLEIVGYNLVPTAPSLLANAVTVTNNSTIDITGFASGTIAGALTIGANTLSVTGSSTGANAAYSLSLGSVNLTGNPNFNVANNGAGEGTLTVGALNDSGTARTITKSGNGTMNLNSAATSLVNGTQVNVTTGTLNSNNATALGSLAAVDVTSGATLVAGASQTLGSLSGTGAVNIGGNTLTVGSSNNLSSTFSGGIAGSSGVLIKSGTGTFILTGSNSYSGGTSVTAGTLLVNNATGNAGAGTGTVTVTGGKIGGSGAFSGALIVGAGGVLSPGASIESLGSGALTLNNGSTFQYEVDSSAALTVGADLQKVTGGLNLNSTVTLTLADLAASPVAFTQGTMFTLINYTGAWNTGLFTYAGNALANGGQFTAGLNTWQIDYSATVGGSNFSSEYAASSNYVNIIAVPEPSTVTLIGLGLGVMLYGFRRRSSV